MTVREYLKRRQVKINLMSMPLVAIAFLIAAFATESLVANAIIFLSVFGYIASVVILMRRTPCPRCSVPLGAIAMQWRSKKLPEPRCPNCSLSIDAQLPESSEK